MSKRFDYDRVTWAIKLYNSSSKKKGEFTGILPLPEKEDYGLDSTATGYTKNGVFDRIPVEFKTITDRFGDVYDGNEWGEFYTGKAMRASKNVKWKTEWKDEGQPLHFINWAKYEKLMKGRGALIYIFEHGLLIFNKKALKNALVGKAAVYGRLTTEFDATYGWQDKAVLDLSKFSEWINYNTPFEYWHDKHGDSREIS